MLTADCTVPAAVPGTWLEALPAAQRQAVLSAGLLRSVTAGAVLFRENEPGDGMYLVREGAVRISAVVGGSDRRTLGIVRAGDFFGEMAVVDDTPRSAMAVADKDSELLFVPRDAMRAILSRFPDLALVLLRESSRRVRDFNRRYVEELLQAERLSLVGRFARSIIHDFKTPLGIIGMTAELGTMPEAGAEARASAAGRIRRQIERLNNMIAELLEFTRGPLGTSVLAPTNYAAFLLPLLEDLREEAALRYGTLELPQPPPSVSVLLEPRRLPNVFFNLVHNALDAMAPQGGKIFIRFKVTEEWVETEIEDTGHGIAPQIADKLFQPFATYGKAKGTGLGLSICQRIIEDHGGAIQARSQPGHGAIFWFRLPRPRGAPRKSTF